VVFLAGALLARMFIPRVVKDPLYQKLCYLGIGLVVVLFINL
jgi:hypothetical protein